MVYKGRRDAERWMAARRKRHGNVEWREGNAAECSAAAALQKWKWVQAGRQCRTRYKVRCRRQVCGGI